MKKATASRFLLCNLNIYIRNFIIKFLPLLFFVTSQPGLAQTPPSGFNNSLASGGYNQPVGVCFSTDGNRMWVWEKSGKVFVSNFVNGSFQKQANPVLNISEEVGNWLDHGMLGFAFDPNFDSNGYIYVSYIVDRHHLLYFGTGSYNSNTDDYKKATIGRITRYKVNNNGGNLAADYNSRKILLGETRSTGIPILFETHGVGSLLFGRDGTLLASCGDGGGAAIDKGNAGETYYLQALSDGIIRPEENVGNFRAQMLNCHSGKILRLDAETGEGVPGNPFYEASNPRAVKSKVWTIGMRNPCRMALKPGTGSYNRNDANPGELMVGDVGQGLWEEFSNIKEGGLNCGWPIYEGIQPANGGFLNASILNRDEPNPLNNQNGCFKPYFSFYGELLREAVPYTPGTPSVNCGSGSFTFPGSWKRYYHHRPVVDWHHARQGDNRARVPIFNGNTASAATIGDWNAYVNGERFEGNAAVGGSWYTGYNFPAEYRGAYFQGDYDGKWIRCFILDGNGKLTEVKRFIDNGANVVCITENFRDGCLYYIDIVSGEVRRISYGAAINNPPVAVASSDKTSGNSPLTVQFTGSGSNDPDGGALSYEWDFGDGTGKNYTANPSHTFYGGGSIGFTVTLTVKDPQNATSTVTLRVSLNNTAPTVRITNPVNNSFYPVGGQENPYVLTANVSDAESANSQLAYAWTISLRHNQHQHFEPVNTANSPTVQLAALGCDGDPYYYFIKLEITDPTGLVGTDSVKIYPDCETFLNARNIASTRGNGFINLTWDNTPYTYSEVMVVAKPATGINGLPAGNGSNYNADAIFQGVGTPFDGGKVVYKGRGTSVNITGLTNGITYNLRVFTRMNTYWTAGLQTSNTPQATGANVSVVTLNSLPAGATLTVNGTARSAPFIYESSQSTAQSIQAIPSFVLNNNTYNFGSWSNGLTSPTLNFTTPNTDVNYTANYNLIPNANNGTGLTSRYYNNANQGFDTPLILTRTDAAVNFTWAGASPGAGINADYFTARWTGQVLPRFSEEYTFYTVSDDGIRLWVNNVLLIDKWIDQGGIESNGKITLNAGQRYDIKIEYYEKGGDATARLLWSSASQTKQVIPSTQFFPENSPTVTIPTITQQPANVSVAETANATFTVIAGGTMPISYQWQKNGINITGATTATYSINGVSLVDNGAKFKCIISNNAGSVTSNEAVLTVTIGGTVPVIVTQPISQVVTSGTNASFVVSATGTAPLSYQWQKNNVNISGATSATYTLTGATVADNGAKFKCVVSNTLGTATSLEATLTVNGGTQNGLTARYYTNTNGFSNPPVLVRVDATLNFNWALTSPDPLISTNNWTARWVGKVRPLFNEEYTFFTVSDDGVRVWVNNVLIIDKWVYQGSVEWNGKISLTAGQLYDIKVEYFEGGGDAVCRLLWSSANQVKQIIPASQLFPEGYIDQTATVPVIVTQPISQVVTSGTNASFVVSATGTAPLSYQWQKNNVNISGATSATYTLTGATIADNGAKFKCVVSNTLGTATSLEATLTVNVVSVPTITVQPTNQTINAGENATFMISAAGATPLTYQWQKNNTNINGATTNTHISNNATLADNGAKFKCIVSNSAGSATSNEAVLTVLNGSNTAPVATIAQPIDAFTYKAGDVLTFSGTGTDIQDGNLGASQFTWWIDVHHDSHVHTGMVATSGITSGTYTIPREHGEATIIFLRVYLKVTDSQGLSTTISKDIQPQWSTLTFNSVPTALALITDNLTTITTPAYIQSVSGVTRTVEAPATYSTGGTAYRFKNWSNGATTPILTFNTPDVNTTFTATYELVPVAAGTGLTGRYFANSDKTFTGTPVLTRTDASINFDWGQTAPSASVGIDNFTVRWTGKVQAQYKEEYTFYTASDDGIRVWVNNVLLINKWWDQGPNVEWSGKISLEANQQYDIKVEYYDNSGRALVRLAWSSASTAKQLVPTSQLFPEVSGGPKNTAAVSKTDEGNQALTEKVFVYPIPTDGVLHVRVMAESEQKGVLQVYDPLGRFMFQKEELFKQGRNDILLDTEKLASGSYYLRVNLKESKITKPFSRE